MRVLFQQTRGVVMMEFLVALMPVMLAFLGLVQFSFAAVAKLVVHHSASLAARAAIVVIEESDNVPGVPVGIYRGLPSGLVETHPPKNSAATDTARSAVQRIASQVRRPGTMTEKFKSLFRSLKGGSSRIDHIRAAAYIPLLTISPNILSEGLAFLAGDITANDTVKTSIGEAGLGRVVGAFIYNLGAVAVTFPEAPGAKQFKKEAYGYDQDVTVRVSYLFRCRVPLVSLFMCDSGWALYSGVAYTDPATWYDINTLRQNRPSNMEELDSWLKRAVTLKRQIQRRQDRIDVFRGQEDEFKQVESMLTQRLLLLQPGARYMMIQQEATLPLQGARYYARGE